MLIAKFAAILFLVLTVVSVVYISMSMPFTELTEVLRAANAATNNS